MKDPRAHMISPQPDPGPHWAEELIRECRAARGALHCHKCGAETLTGLHLIGGYTCGDCDTARSRS